MSGSQQLCSRRRRSRDDCSLAFARYKLMEVMEDTDGSVLHDCLQIYWQAFHVTITVGGLLFVS